MYLILESLQGPDLLVYIKSRTNCKVRCGQWASYGLQIYRTDLHCLCTVRPIKKFTFRSYGTVIISLRI